MTAVRPGISERLRAAASLLEAAEVDSARVIGAYFYTGDEHSSDISMQGDPIAIQALADAAGATAPDDVRIGQGGVGYRTWTGIWQGIDLRLTEQHPAVTA